MRMLDPARKTAEAVAAAMMGAMFATFILQVTVRYSARAEVIAETLPFLDPANFGWTLEFCLLLWVWIIFWGNAFVVRNEDHVTFDILYIAVPPRVRRAFVIIGALAVIIGLLASIAPTLDRFHILRLKKTATLSALFGDWIRMRDIYYVYILFLVVVPIRYGWAIWQAVRDGVDEPHPHPEGRIDE